MDILVVDHAQVRKLMTMEECIDVMKNALKSLTVGKAGMPLRSVMPLSGNTGFLGMMPAYMEDLNIMGLKVISVFPANHESGYDSHQGAVMIFETVHGKPLAMVDAGSITAIRTAAVSAVATDLLAREDAGDLAILGSGTQAVSHLEALLVVRKIRQVRVWSLPMDHARQFARTQSKRKGINIEPFETVHEAVQGADIICTLTPSPEPILLGSSIMSGAHINAIGACTSVARELDTDAVVKSRLFVDRRESTISEAGDFMIPKKEGAIDDAHILGEIGELLTGRVEGRKTEHEITLFKSLGLAVEDLAAAYYIFQKAKEKKAGMLTPLGGMRDDNA